MVCIFSRTSTLSSHTSDTNTTWRPRSPPPAASVWPRLWPQCWTARQVVYIAIISPGHRREALCGCRTKPATRFILQSIEANAHLVKEEGSVGGKPKRWRETPSPRTILWTHRSCDYRDPGMEIAEQQRKKQTHLQPERSRTRCKDRCETGMKSVKVQTEKHLWDSSSTRVSWWTREGYCLWDV